MINLILFGPPGSGKGTQAKLLVEKYKLHHISTGDIFRREMKNDTDLGKEAKSYIAKGALVPDSVTIGMLRKEVESNPDVAGYIFDGFPRTVPQAEALDTLMKELNQSISCLLELKVQDDELRNRLMERGKTSGRADDVDPNVINDRISVYKEKTLPVANHYAGQNKANEVNGIGTIEEVFGRLSERIDAVS